jgi:hypothetical protein
VQDEPFTEAIGDEEERRGDRESAESAEQAEPDGDRDQRHATF